MDLNGKRVAIVMMSAVGDAVHVLPLVNSLKAAYPGVHLTWIIQPGPHALVKDHPAVDEFVVFDRKRGWRAFADVRRAVRGKRFDLVIALQVYFKAGLITAMLDSPRKLGFDRVRARDANWLFTTERIPARGQRHVQDQYFEFLEHLGVPVVLEWGLGPTEEERRRRSHSRRSSGGWAVSRFTASAAAVSRSDFPPTSTQRAPSSSWRRSASAA